MADGRGSARTDLMSNDFVIVGPATDPAGVAGMTDVKAALGQIVRKASVASDDKARADGRLELLPNFWPQIAVGAGSGCATAYPCAIPPAGSGLQGQTGSPSPVTSVADGRRAACLHSVFQGIPDRNPWTLRGKDQFSTAYARVIVAFCGESVSSL
jgi:hypothetical protein